MASAMSLTICISCRLSGMAALGAGVGDLGLGVLGVQASWSTRISFGPLPRTVLWAALP
jgi:hypothetical protein